MVKTVALLVVLVLSASRACNARELLTNGLSRGESMTSDVSVLQIHCNESEVGAKDSKEVSRNKNMCALCEEFATQAFNYLQENNTQTQIIDILHMACSKSRRFEQQCIALVDYYIPLFFLEVESVKPEDFCQKVNLCKQKLVTSWPLSGDKCDICRDAIAEVLLKLKDPDTKLDILEILLKACGAVENHLKKCKTLVFKYGPLILGGAVRFLEKTNICSAIHACNSSFCVVTKRASSMEKAPMLSAM